MIGYLNEFGLGVPQNYKKASLWYYQVIVPNLYNKVPLERAISYFYGGNGYKVNYKKSAEWFRMAAELSLDGY